MLKDRDSKQSIQVTIRVRPLLEKQLADDPRICVVCEQANSLQLHGGAEVRKFTFDSICFNQSQEQIFARVGRKCTLDCLQGYNCTIFAYGQTGAGKTYTMMGLNFEHQNYYQQRGLIPRTMQFLFECIDREREAGVNFVIRCTFLEIYNEQIIDLLNKSNTNMQLREDTRKGVYVQGLTEQMISKSDEAMDILYKGSKSRHVGSTFYNETSSRSHSVFTLQIESRYAKNGVVNTKSRQFNFIDLAGSQRTKQSTGERLKEGCNINKSLMNLAAVINALSEVSEGKPQHVNYRNSKLTFLLKDSLGGNSKTNLIANISPAFSFFQQTLSTLGFARRAKLIKRQKACINEDTSGNLDSMKNQIKRLKQQIISLMSRQQVEGVSELPSGSASTQMTTIMHEYVSQEIDKQTKLQVQIRRLNDRIIQLQTGVKIYSNNQIHLRMIIAVYEDKISRLKQVEKILAEKVQLLNQEDEQAKIVIEYFKNERENLIKEIDILKKHAESGKFLKELLKEAKVIKDEGQDETLKELLEKNSSFLTTIYSKLDEIRPQKAQFQNGTQFQKKIAAMTKQFAKKQEENSQRLQQLNLDLAEFKTRNEQNQKLIQQAVGAQIGLQERAKAAEEQNVKLASQIKHMKQQLKNVQTEIGLKQAKSQEQLLQLNTDLLNTRSQVQLLKRQLATFQNNLQVLTASESSLRKEVHDLQDEKHKFEKTITQNMQQLRQSKNKNVKLQSEISMIQQKLQSLIKQNQKQKEQHNKISEQLTEQKKNSKAKIEQLTQRQKISVQAYIDKQNALTVQIEQKDARIINLQSQLFKSVQSLEISCTERNQKQIQLKEQIKSKDEKINQLIGLVNQKEVTDSELYNELNKTKLQLINTHSEHEAKENKLKKNIQEYKEKLNKQKANYDLLQVQANERVKQYDKLNQQFKLKKKQCLQMTETNAKLTAKIQNLLQENQAINQKLQQSCVQLQNLQESTKQYKLGMIQAKNQIVIINKNSQMEIDSLRHQMGLRDQQIHQLQKQLSKNKDKFERQIMQLQAQKINTREMFQSHEQSIKNNMQNHLILKQKKITELKNLLQELDDRLKTTSKQQIQFQLSLQQITSKYRSLEAQNGTKDKVIISLQHKLQQQATDILELQQSHGKQIQELLITHGQQIDHKNKQIQNYMSQTQLLTKQIESFKQQIIQITQMKQQMATHVEQIKLQKTNGVRTLQQQHQIQLQRLNQQIEQLKEEQTHLKAQLTLKYSQEMQQLRIQKSSQIKQLTQEKATLAQEYNLQRASLLKIQKELKEQIQISHQKQSDLYIQNNDLAVKLQTLSNQFQQYKYTKDQQIQNIYKSQGQNLCQIIKTNNQLKQQIILLTSSYQKQQKIAQANVEQIVILKETLFTKQKQLDAVSFSMSNNQKQIEALKTELSILQERLKQTSSHINLIQLEKQKISTQSRSNIINLITEHEVVCSDLQKLQKSSLQNNQKISQLNKYIYELTKILQNQKITVQNLVVVNKALEERIKPIEEDRKKLLNQLNRVKEQMNTRCLTYDDQVSTLSESCRQLSKQNSSMQQFVSLKVKEIHQIQQRLSEERDNKDKLNNQNQQLSLQIQKISVYKQKWQFQSAQMLKLKNQILNEQGTNQKIHEDLQEQRENSNNLKMIIENTESQIRQLQIQLEEKDAIYKKLLQKIAKNENESKKTTNSQHYLKTIELLEKSRAEQLQLRRQNEDLRKSINQLKQNLDEKDRYVRQVQKKSQTYCISIHKRLEQIQTDYVQLEKKQQKLLKEKKSLEKMVHEAEMLKISIGKLNQKNEELQSRLKKSNLDYIQLETEFTELKKGQLIANSNDDKTGYINKLKAEVAALKTQKVLLTDTLNKERQEKTKLKADMRYGKDGNDFSLKVELQKKINENKNLQQLILQIVNQLKICVVEPKTKLQAIRSVIMGTIKQKNNEVKFLKQKIKEYEAELQQQRAPKIQPLRETRQIKALSISNTRNGSHAQESYRFEKQKDQTYLNNNSRQKMKEFQNYYAKFHKADEARNK